MKANPLAVRLARKWVEKRKDQFPAISQELRRARMATTPEAFLSNVYFFSLLGGVAGAAVGGLVGYLLVFVLKIGSGPITKLSRESVQGFLQYKDPMLFAVFFLLCFFGLMMLTRALVRGGPRSRAGSRKGRINKVLPYAVTYMYAMSKGGMNIIEVFRSLARAKEIYGEVSVEFQGIVNDMEIFGNDLRTAIQHAIENSPSPKFQEMLHSLLTVIDSGGNMVSFFQEKANQYLDAAIQDQKGFLETLGLMAESYVTAFVAGPLFIVIIQTVIGLVQGGSPIALYAITYMLIPAGSGMFLFTIYIITPQDAGKAPLLKLEKSLDVNVELPEEGTPEREKYEAILETRKKLALKKRLDLWNYCLEEPFRALILSGPAALGVFFILFALNPNALQNQFIDDMMIIMGIVLVTPVSVFYEIKAKREKKIRNEIPDFLHRMALTNEIGMTMSESIELMSKQAHGALTEEIKKIHRDMIWGMSVQDAFARFANRLRIGSVSRTVKLLTQALKSSGDVREVLDITAKDARTVHVLEKERALNMLIYVVIIFMSFGVFTIVVFIMAATFLPEIERASANVSKSGVSVLAGVDVPLYKRIFFHAAILQGFGSGLMAGQMGQGKAMAGLKYSVGMVIGAWVMFRLFI
ncbi:MAG: type II secretion system F family protein [Halobacteria archaeon]